VNLYTIGFTGKSAEQFFTLLRDAGVQRLVDTRLYPSTQLSGFAKAKDLSWLLGEVANCSYVRLKELAPTPEILRDYRKDNDWKHYVQRFEELIDARTIPNALDRASFEAAASCLLCAEPAPDFCHRRLVAERLAAAWPGTAVIHLV
jgi:uncharacterized protein (DUF488 family)